MSTLEDSKTKVTSIFFEDEIPPFYKRWWFWLLIIGIIIAGVIFYFVYQSGALSIAPKNIISPLAN